MRRLTEEIEAEKFALFCHEEAPYGLQVFGLELRQELSVVRTDLAEAKAERDAHKEQRAVLKDRVCQLTSELTEAHAQSVEASRLSTDLELQLRSELAEARAKNEAIVSQHMNASLEREAAFKALANAPARTAELTEDNRRLANLAMHLPEGV